MNEVMAQLAAVAQQYMQTQSPEAAMQLVQMVAQAQDPQLLMMVADQIAAAVGGAGDPAMQGGGAPMAAAGAAPMGANGMTLPNPTQQPMYKNGGKLSALDKLKQKRKDGSQKGTNRIVTK